MKEAYHIKYLKNPEIDKLEWDDCIRKSANGLIYAESAYLDHMAANWDALVLNDYEAVMPLTWKRKWGIKYLYQPPFIQQGGIFFKKQLTAKTIQSFITEASHKFKFAEFTINYLNEFPSGKGLQVKMRNNFILQLGDGYKHIAQRYNSYIKQRLSRLSKFSLQYKHVNDITSAIKLYRNLYG